MTGSNAGRAYKAGVAVVILASFLTVWTTIVRDDGTGMGFFELIMAAAVGAVAAWFRPAGMARTMAGVAVIQILLGIAMATAPSTASVAGGPTKALLFSGFFAAMWLASAACFRVAATADRSAPVTQ
ncbi:MAG: hypothetical protein ACTHM0_01475 [Sphingomonas sp.]